MFSPSFNIGKIEIGRDLPPQIIAEISGNHGGDIAIAFELLEACATAGLKLVKFQTYTPDTITINSDAPAFIVKNELWKDESLYQLYEKAHTPFEWHKPLFEKARELGLTPLSSPFDSTAVDLLESLDAPAYKIASCEIVDFPLIDRIAATGKPVIISSGAADVSEVEAALNRLGEKGSKDVCLLHCISAYPTPSEQARLATIPFLHERFRLPVGFSDHTIGATAPIVATALGACVVEKHVRLASAGETVDSAFSATADELGEINRQIQEAFKAARHIKTESLEIEKESERFKRSLFVVANVLAGTVITPEHVRSIRPAGGLHTKHLEDILGKKASRDLKSGLPFEWNMIEKGE